ncbi:hypothetical protein ACFTTN_03370 [Streptomyces niveus]|uniref:hypothetical protein n=1 Tax=Streptomyces niveus TaxID=193462 RepID=UPI00363EAF5F
MVLAVGGLALTGFEAAATPVETPAQTERQVASAEPQAVTLYSYKSEPGEWIGGGTSGRYDSLTVRSVADSSPEKIHLYATNWDIEFAAPQGEPLRPGVYRNVERIAGRTGRAPGMQVSAFNRGCNEIFGRFTINQIEFDSSGVATLIDLTFTQRCDSADAPALTGNIKYQAFPLSYSYTSESGDYIGSGISNNHTGSTSLFNLTGSTSGIVTHSGSGKRESWRTQFAAPEGEQLQVGRTYQTADIGDETAAFLSVAHESRGCSGKTGELTLARLATDEQGNITALAATFLQRCGGTTAALRGTIHYYA